MEPRHILVIDDDVGTRDALADILVRAGFAVSTWEGDADLEAVCTGRRYQVAVVDFHLPFQNGLEVARRLKQLQPECRIILISSELPTVQDALASSEAVDRFLSKPFSKDTFLEAVGQLC
jgi:FixJ family two-component response regulator|uniref:Response regulator n=1 Tax=Desulfobacca acetoxidans TaxID=60893 RepID=A0A7C3SI73_9BACT